jgi:hypothetical protein
MLSVKFMELLSIFETKIIDTGIVLGFSGQSLSKFNSEQKYPLSRYHQELFKEGSLYKGNYTDSQIKALKS